jgi:alkanesulfonate monooxygenase SsuD/methylene tetrahydromethanopterin reductase-like flavin-dependent oxidoreductase (luciferase family)
MLVDIQIMPSLIEWPHLLDEVLRAEDQGFAAAWVYDHLAGQSLDGHTMLECFATLGALAATTSRISLGTMVVNMSLREPAVVVNAAASVQLISRRPFLLGLGAGAGPTSRWAGELHAAGVSPPAAMADRHAKVKRTLAMCQQMWSPDRDAAVATFPMPAPAPLRLVGVNSSPALARLAGRSADGINLWWDNPQRDALMAAAEAALTPGRCFLRTCWIMDFDGSLDPDHPTRRAMAAADIDRLLLVRRPPAP